jgi:hypothetical protein
MSLLSSSFESRSVPNGQVSHCIVTFSGSRYFFTSAKTSGLLRMAMFAAMTSSLYVVLDHGDGFRCTWNHTYQAHGAAEPLHQDGRLLTPYPNSQ